MNLATIPAVNASLNAAGAVLLLTGYVLIRKGRIAAHRWAMSGAFLVSLAFLASYLFYHYHVGSVRFHGPALLRIPYLVILVSHSVLAALIAPLSLRVLYLAWRGRFGEHKRWARWALPVWLYVSITGIIVYWMLYRL